MISCLKLSLEHTASVESLIYLIYDSYEEDPSSLAGLGGVLKLLELLDPRECRGEPSKCVSWNENTYL